MAQPRRKGILIPLGLALLGLSTAWNAGAMLLHLITLGAHDPLWWLSTVAAGLALVGSIVGFVLLGIVLARKSWR